MDCLHGLKIIQMMLLNKLPVIMEAHAEEQEFHIQSEYRRRKFFLYNGNDNLEILGQSPLRKAKKTQILKYDEPLKPRIIE